MDLKALSRHPDLAHEWMERQQKENEKLLREVVRLREYIFGEKRERYAPDDQQQTLPFEGIESVAVPDYVNEAPDEESEGEEEKAPKKKRPRGITKISPEVPRIPHEVPVPLEERTCQNCHGEMQPFDVDKKYIIDFVPARLEVHEYARPKYSCPKCKNCVVTAAVPESPIDKGMPGPGLLAQICVQKWADHLPLNRQEAIFARYGIELSKKTMCDWGACVTEMLTPVAWALAHLVFHSSSVHADETGILVNMPKVKSGQKRGFLWVCQNRRGEVIFRFNASRGSEAAKELLINYRGRLQVDGYAGYDFLFRNTARPIEVGCWVHARRYFIKAKVANPLEADYVLRKIQGLYAIERDAKERKLKRGQIKQLRQEKSAPILATLHEWLLQHKEKWPPKDAITDAIEYMLNRWTSLNQYLREGSLVMDNNPIERSIRQVAVGRKNWLFAGSPAGAHRAALLYSIIVTCKNLGVNPFEYLRDVISRVKTHPPDRMVELTPRFWKRAQEKAALAV